MNNVSIFGVHISSYLFIAIIVIGSLAATALIVSDLSNIGRVGILAFGGMWLTAGWIIRVMIEKIH